MKSELTIRNCVFTFKCDAKWEDLDEVISDDYLDIEKIRFCSNCQKEVFLSESDAELVKNIRLNRCVAIIRMDGLFQDNQIGEISLAS